jgi:hypothetical protein
MLPVAGTMPLLMALRCLPTESYSAHLDLSGAKGDESRLDRAIDDFGFDRLPPIGKLWWV